jgi:hypothetical protein
MAEKATKDRFARYCGLLSGEVAENQNHDEVLNELLDLGEKDLLHKWEMQGGFYIKNPEGHEAHNKHRKILGESLRARDVVKRNREIEKANAAVIRDEETGR